MKIIILLFLLSICFYSCSETRTGHKIARWLGINTGNFEPNEFKIDTNAHWLVKLTERKGHKLAPNYKTRNCVQFMHDLLRPNYRFTQAEKDAIYIKGISTKQIETALEKKDSSKVTGICKVLVDKGLATWVHENDSLKPGDIVQYWFQILNDPLIGHTGVVGEANHREFHLLSSGYSQDGYGYKYVTEFWCEAFFAVRLKNKKAN